MKEMRMYTELRKLAKGSRPDLFCRKETSLQVFFSEFCKYFKNSFICGTPSVATSDAIKKYPEKVLYASLLRMAKLDVCIVGTS